jgi:hypothetical protein
MALVQLTRARAVLPGLVVLLTFATGCSNHAELSGLVTDSGQPVTLQGGGENPQVYLEGQDEDNQRTLACGLPQNNGRFVAYWVDGSKRLQPGKYKIGFVYGSAKPKTGSDFYPGEANVEIELAAGEKADMIDAAKRTVTKQKQE